MSLFNDLKLLIAKLMIDRTDVGDEVELSVDIKELERLEKKLKKSEMYVSAIQDGDKVNVGIFRIHESETNPPTVEKTFKK